MPEKIDSVAVEVHFNLNGPLWSSEFNLIFARNIKFLIFTSTFVLYLFRKTWDQVF